MSSIGPTMNSNPNDPWKTWPVTVRRLRSHSTSVFTVDLEFDDPDRCRQYSYAPGQFNMLYVPGVGEAAISISGTTPSGLLQHTIRSVGAVTQAIEAGGVGMSFGLRGPFGSAWPLELETVTSFQSPATLPSQRSSNGDIVIVAGGIGLAPLRSLVNYIASHRDQYGTVHIVIGARTPDDLLFQDEYDDWRSQSMKVSCTVDRARSDWKGQIGVVTLLLERLDIPRPSLTTVMTCGPEVMMRYTAKSALGRGIPEQQIHVTLERNMNCAIGLCGHCQLGPMFICKDGPVFRYDRVRDLLRIQEL